MGEGEMSRRPQKMMLVGHREGKVTVNASFVPGTELGIGADDSSLQRQGDERP